MPIYLLFQMQMEVFPKSNGNTLPPESRAR